MKKITLITAPNGEAIPDLLAITLSEADVVLWLATMDEVEKGAASSILGFSSRCPADGAELRDIRRFLDQAKDLGRDFRRIAADQADAFATFMEENPDGYPHDSYEARVKSYRVRIQGWYDGAEMYTHRFTRALLDTLLVYLRPEEMVDFEDRWENPPLHERKRPLTHLRPRLAPRAGGRGFKPPVLRREGSPEDAACDNDGVTHRVDGKELLVSDGEGFTLGVDTKYHAKVLHYAEKNLFKVNGRLWVDPSRLVWVWGLFNGIQVCGGESPVSVGGTADEIKRVAKAARLTRVAPKIYAKLEHALYLHVDVDGDHLLEMGRHPSATSYLKVTKAYAPRLIASLAGRGWGWHKSGTMVNPSMLALREKNSVIALRNLGLSIRVLMRLGARPFGPFRGNCAWMDGGAAAILPGRDRRADSQALQHHADESPAKSSSCSRDGVHGCPGRSVTQGRLTPMTLGVIYFMETRYRPAPEAEAQAKNHLLDMLRGGLRDFFSLCAQSRKAGVRDNDFDYVFRQCKDDGAIRMTDDFQVSLV